MSSWQNNSGSQSGKHTRIWRARLLTGPTPCTKQKHNGVTSHELNEVGQSSLRRQLKQPLFASSCLVACFNSSTVSWISTPTKKNLEADSTFTNNCDNRQLLCARNKCLVCWNWFLQLCFSPHELHLCFLGSAHHCGEGPIPSVLCVLI